MEQVDLIILLQVRKLSTKPLPLIIPAFAGIYN
jgi:hypothetical protein